MKDAMMPFGSMCNSYGLVNKGSNKPTEEFLEDMKQLMDLAEEFCQPKQNDKLLNFKDVKLNE
jgi:hypothetical protein